MTDSTKILGQANPSAGVLTTLYTVPAAKASTSSSLVVCNTGSTDAKFRVSVAVAGAADAVKQYLYYDEDVPANETFIATIGLTLGAADVVRCYANSSNLAFALFGVEV